MAFVKPCPVCRGTGRVRAGKADTAEINIVVVHCRACDGAGWNWETARDEHTGVEFLWRPHRIMAIGP